MAAHHQYFREIVDNMFNRWSALQLAVVHGMGGFNGHEVTIFRTLHGIISPDHIPCPIPESNAVHGGHICVLHPERNETGQR